MSNAERSGGHLPNPTERNIIGTQPRENEAMKECYGRTVGGGRCELPDGHYPATHHHITWPEPHPGFMSWTDESMAEFQRIADEQAATT